MTAPRNYGLITSLDALKALIDKLMADEKKIGFDLETGYLGPDRKKGSLQIDWDQQFISGFSITNDTRWARYVPVAHEFGDNVPEEQAWELMKPVLETLPTVAHNMRFEVRNCRALDRKGRGPRIDINVHGDSALQSYALALYERHGLKSLVKSVFDHDQPELDSLFPGAKKKDLDALRFSVLDMYDPQVRDYACEDAVWTLALDEKFMPLIQSTGRDFIYQVEMLIMSVLCDMEDAGHAVAWDEIEKAYALGLPFEEEMKGAAKSLLSKMAGEDLSGMNLGSTPQMREVLYNKIGLTTNRKTDKGELSTDAIALEALSREHVAVKKVLEVREVHNLIARQKKWLGEYSGSYDSRVHASFNQVVVPSGRFSANDPAIQQLPKDWRWSIFPKVDPWDSEHWAAVREKTDHGKHYWEGNFRDFMIAAPGCYLIGFDYSQVELRAMAGMSQEPALLKSFNEDEDVHTLTTAMMLGIPVESVTKRDRAIGKTMNFALLYGMGEASLAERLAISYMEAEALYAKYFSAFTKVTQWMDEMKTLGKNRGYVETAFGRRVTVWEFLSSNRAIYNKGERLCVNAPVQGTAADIMKLAMVRAVRALKARGWWMTHVRLINNIHDALVFEADNSVDPRELREVLQEAVVWDVVAPDGTRFPKIVADWEIGHLWGSCKSWGSEPVEFKDGAWQIVSEAPADGLISKTAVEEAREPVREEEPDHFTVELDHMPSADPWRAFTALLTEKHGENVVTLITPQGRLELHKIPTSLTAEDDQGLISLTLGGARVYRPVEEIDAEAMTADLEF